MPIKIFISPPFFFSYFLTVLSFLEFHLFFSFPLFHFSFFLHFFCLNLQIFAFNAFISFLLHGSINNNFVPPIFNSFISLGAHQCCLLALWVAICRINNLALLSSWPDVHSIDIQIIFFIGTMSTALVK